VSTHSAAGAGVNSLRRLSFRRVERPGSRRGGAQRIIDRFEPAGLVVEIPQIVLHEGDEPDALADLRQADILPGKHRTEIYLLSAKADAAAVRHGDRLIVKRVGQVFKAAIHAWRSRVEVGRDFHVQRLMGPVPVVPLNECVKARLLRDV